MDPAGLNKKAAAAYLGVGLRTIDRLIQHGDIPVVRLGRRVIVRRETLDTFLRFREQIEHEQLRSRHE